MGEINTEPCGSILKYTLLLIEQKDGVGSYIQKASCYSDNRKIIERENIGGAWGVVTCKVTERA